MSNTIAFPGLGLSFDINRVAFTIFGKEIYWYGVIICVGFFLGVYYLSRRTAQFGINNDQLFDILLWTLPLAIVGARLYYVIFQWKDYQDNPLEIIAVWHGGLAIYGGVIAALLTLFVYARLHHINPFDLFDQAALGLLIGQSIGRWGNFVNAEAFGSETNLPWRMVINDAAVGVHPTFLYESLWNAVGFVLLHFHSKHRRFKGELVLLYIVWYGLGRTWIEGLRTDSLYLAGTGIRVSQLLAFLSFVVGTVLLIIGNKRYAGNAALAAAEEESTSSDTALGSDDQPETADTAENGSTPRTEEAASGESETDEDDTEREEST